MTIRKRLDEKCRHCGKSKDQAAEICPVAQGKWMLGPEWACGDCMDKIEVVPWGSAFLTTLFLLLVIMITFK